MMEKTMQLRDMLIAAVIKRRLNVAAVFAGGVD
jgi:hypothetical protein